MTGPSDSRERARATFWLVATWLGRLVIGICVVLVIVMLGLLGLCLFMR